MPLRTTPTYFPLAWRWAYKDIPAYDVTQYYLDAAAGSSSTSSSSPSAAASSSSLPGTDTAAGGGGGNAGAGAAAEAEADPGGSMYAYEDGSPLGPSRAGASKGLVGL